MGLLWINLFVIPRSCKNPLCSKKGTVVGIVQNNPSLSQGMAQISDSRSILKPNRVIPSMFLIPQPCAYMFLTRFTSSHHRLSEIRQPKPKLWRRKFWVLSNRHVGYSPRCTPIQEPLGDTVPSPQHFAFEIKRTAL